jgi:hypothetical protein
MEEILSANRLDSSLRKENHLVIVRAAVFSLRREGGL